MFVKYLSANRAESTVGTGNTLILRAAAANGIYAVRQVIARFHVTFLVEWRYSNGISVVDEVIHTEFRKAKIAVAFAVRSLNIICQRTTYQVLTVCFTIADASALVQVCTYKEVQLALTHVYIKSGDEFACERHAAQALDDSS